MAKKIELAVEGTLPQDTPTDDAPDAAVAVSLSLLIQLRDHARRTGADDLADQIRL